MRHERDRQAADLGGFKSFLETLEFDSTSLSKLTPTDLIYQMVEYDHAGFQALMNGERPRYLGATVIEEQTYVEWLSSQVDLSKGVIVDLGCWLGSFSNAASKGIRRNPTAPVGKKLVYAFDRFTWTDCFEDWVRNTPLAGRYQEGDNFLDAFVQQTQENADLLVACSEDLENATWNGGPISLLINDVWKNFTIAKSTARAFFPQIQPGGMLINQDYLWCTDALVQVYMYRLREFFKPVFQVPKGNAVAFQCISPPDTASLDSLPSGLSEISPEEIDAAVDWSRSFLNVTGRGAVELGRIWLHLQQGNRELAMSLGKALILNETEGKDPFVLWQKDILWNWGYWYLFWWE